MNDIELKPCPFCGALPELEVWEDCGLVIQCSSSLTDCPMNPNYAHYVPADAVAQWNRRAALTDPKELMRKESEEKRSPVCGGMAASGADGFVLVPRELTHEMYCAFVEQWFAKRRAIDDAEMDDCYAAMLAARPEISP